jgi:20S proteasome alpha/beta subunit
MTTIAFTNGMVAVDSQATSGSWRDPYPYQKIFPQHDGSVIVGAGAVAEICAFVAWLSNSDREEAEPQPALEESTIVHFRKDGEVWVYEMSAAYQHPHNFGAWGSGAPVAHAALLMGATATRALEVACELDVFSGLPIYTCAVPVKKAAEAA